MLIMKHNEVNLFQDIYYYGLLETICGVRFTPREIDVIACLLSGRATKSVADFLSIEEKTVETHKHNIMRKLECNSKEGIRGFIEKSDKLLIVKKHYLGLLIQGIFEGSLQEVLKLLGTDTQTCSLVYWREKASEKSLINFIEKHLKLAGIEILTEVKESRQSLDRLIHNIKYQTVDYVIYIFPETLVTRLQRVDSKRKLEDFSFVQRLQKNPRSVIFLLRDRNYSDRLPQEIQEAGCIYFDGQENYYFFIFEILKKVLPDKNIDKIILEFRNKYEAINDFYKKSDLCQKNKFLEEEPQKPSFFQATFKKKQIFLFIGGTSFFCICYLLFYNSNDTSVLQYLQARQNLQSESVSGLLFNLRKQSQKTRDLLYQLSFKQAVGQIYRFIKPTLKEIEQLKNELHKLNSQLMILKSSKLSLQNISLESEMKSQIMNELQLEEQQLEIAKQSVTALLMYMEGNKSQADVQLDTLIATLNKGASSLPDLDKNLLLNRAYNLKAKIAAIQTGKKKSSAEFYKKATQLLPYDVITWSNYGGLLIDLGREEKNANLYIEAYRCYEQVYPLLEQINLEQLPVVCSGMAYGFILLAQSIEQQKIDYIQARLPNVTELRHQAQKLLNRAIQANPSYPNAHLFLSILLYDKKNYAMALQEINNALSSHPTHSTALMRKGLILYKLGKKGDAVELLRLAQNSQKNKKNGNNFNEVDEEIEELGR
jgi:Tfp pilus assembly protein PilF